MKLYIIVIIIFLAKRNYFFYVSTSLSQVPLGAKLRPGARVTAEAKTDRVQASRNSRAVGRREASKATESFRTLDM